MQVKFKYFDFSGLNGFSGRGGAVRFYMLLHNIQFDEELISLDAWGQHVKADYIKRGESPAGHLPIVYINNGQPMVETIAILRRFSKQVGEYGKDIEMDYWVDAVADAAAEFRTALVTSAFGSAEDEAGYLAGGKRKHYYSMLNTFLDKGKASGTCIVADKPSFAGSLVFGILWDDLVKYGKDLSLWDSYPKVVAFFEEFLKQEQVSKWCKGVRPDLVQELTGV